MRRPFSTDMLSSWGANYNWPMWTSLVLPVRHPIRQRHLSTWFQPYRRGTWVIQFTHSHTHTVTHHMFRVRFRVRNVENSTKSIQHTNMHFIHGYSGMCCEARKNTPHNTASQRLVRLHFAHSNTVAAGVWLLLEHERTYALTPMYLQLQTASTNSFSLARILHLLRYCNFETWFSF